MSVDPIEIAAPLERFNPLFADVAAKLESDPQAWEALWRDPVLRAISNVGVPAEFNPHPFADAELGTATCDYPLHLAIVEQLARGSASTLMALPGSSLSTSVILKLANRAQQEHFFAPFASGPAFSFFAITEPERGSDATQAQTRLDPTPTGFVLNGEKMLIGGAGIARTGLVLARQSATGQLVFVLLSGQQNDKSFHVEKLGMTGLKGAGLSRLTFENHVLAKDAVIAPDARLPALLALTGVFERHRPIVAAMALGTARGMLDRLADHDQHDRLGALRLTHETLLRRMIGLALLGDTRVFDANAISTLKFSAVQLVDRVRAATVELAGPALFADAQLRRFWRDAGAFEYMEGTSHIHALNIYRAFAAERTRHVDVS